MSLSSSQVLQVSATRRDPGVAAEHAIAVARAYLKFQGQRDAIRVAGDPAVSHVRQLIRGK